MFLISVFAIVCFLTDLYAPISGCNLKASKKIFLDSSGIPWTCRDYCPDIRGCLGQCCPPKVPPKAPEPDVPEPPVPERKKIWPVAIPWFVAGCLLIAAVWKLLKNRRSNSGQDVEADRLHPEQCFNDGNRGVEVQEGTVPEDEVPEDEEEVPEAALTLDDEVNFIELEGQRNGSENEEFMLSIQETSV